MAGYEIREIDAMAAVNGGTTKLAGAELGVRSFGLQIFDFPPGFLNYPEHEHADEGMEEVYVVLEGSAEFTIDGERVAVARDRVLWVAPESRRKLVPGPDGVRILALGAVPGGAYERPEGLQLRS